jgi:hypothetical protein
MNVSRYSRCLSLCAVLALALISLAAIAQTPVAALRWTVVPQAQGYALRVCNPLAYPVALQHVRLKPEIGADIYPARLSAATHVPAHGQLLLPLRGAGHAAALRQLLSSAAITMTEVSYQILDPQGGVHGYNAIPQLGDALFAAPRQASHATPLPGARHATRPPRHARHPGASVLKARTHHA